MIQKPSVKILLIIVLLTTPFIASATTITLQDGLDGYSGTSDADINMYATAVNTGSATTTRLGTYGAQKSLFKFDLSSIPSGATITSAALGLYVLSSSGNGGGNKVNLYKILGSWTEMGVTWGNFSASANYGATAESSPTIGYAPANQAISIPITSLVQSWVGGSIANNGVMVSVSNGPVAIIVSRENSSTTLRPQLVVDYAPLGSVPPQPVSDTQAPTTPTSLIATVVSASQINLSWSASTDDTGVTGYAIYSNGAQLTTTVATSYSNTSLTASTAYSYTVSAYDAAGNSSTQSAGASATTQAPASVSAPASAPAPAPSSPPSVPSTGVYYVSPTGSDTNSGTTSEVPWKTFAKAWGVLQPGNTLILRDGTYTEALRPTISGIVGNPITIKAENDGKAILDGQNTHSGISINARHYLTLEGLLSINPGEASALIIGAADGDYTSSHDITIRRTGVRGGTNLSNGPAFSVARTKDSLLEDVWVYGYGRYALNVYGSQNITVRRAVIRWDRWDGTNYKPCDPKFNLGVYDTHDSTFENILLIDGGVASCGDHGGLYVPGNNNGNTSPFINSANNKFYAVIALNNRGNGLQTEGGSGGINDNNSFRDVVSWGNTTGISVNKATNTVFNHATIAKNGNGSWTGAVTTINNSLVASNTGFGLHGMISSNYNNVFGNGISDKYVSVGAQDISSNPDIKYITRLESGAAGKGTGSDGGDRAATVLYQYFAGVLTSTSMWPWPNETRIQQDMCDSAFLTAVGRTGTNDAKWCTSGKSLTQYIWEAAGNPMPANLYDGNPPAPVSTPNTTTPAPVTTAPTSPQTNTNPPPNTAPATPPTTTPSTTTTTAGTPPTATAPTPPAATSVAKSSGLSTTQINAIIQLLQSFGADQSVVTNVQATLTGGTPTTGNTTVQPGTSTSLSATSALPTTSLSVGQKGTQVLRLQQALTNLGFYNGPLTSYFGTATKAALIKFQKAKGIPATGYFGPLSRAKLR